MTGNSAAPVREQRRGDYRLFVAYALTGAFLVAAGISGGLATADLLASELPGHPAPLWVLHLIGFGTAALALVDRTWSWWIVAVTTAGFIVVGVQLYSVLFMPGMLTTVVWFANDMHIGLLVVAEYLCVRRLVSAGPC
jgi:hypothetical protein